METHSQRLTRNGTMMWGEFVRDQTCKHFQISIIYAPSTDGLLGKTLDSENGSSGEGSEPDAAKNRSETDLLMDKNGWPMLPTLDSQSF